ncbi:MAG TPA: helix-turn-helix domain-containing protein [Acidimicrobiales bacterium]|nr:helix-turn-helix domain-containing protein [Acidimicrobiales bacterium]
MSTTLQQQARALGDPTRHAIFRYLVDAARPVGVAELTEHFALNHNAIRQHLAKLVDADLASESAEPVGGPGRPRLVYEVDPATESRWGATGPYERLSLLLAEIIASGDTPVEVGRRAVEDHPVPAATPEAAVADVAAVMARQGFEPEVRRRGTGIEIALGTCPFETVAAARPDVVCALHLGLAEGLADKADIAVTELVARDPRRAGCCLRLDLSPREGAAPHRGRLTHAPDRRRADRAGDGG